MSSTIITKNSSTAAAAPVTADLAAGELAVNTTDGTLYVGTGSGVTQIVGGGNAGDLSANNTWTALNTFSAGVSIGPTALAPSSYLSQAVVDGDLSVRDGGSLRMWNASDSGGVYINAAAGNEDMVFWKYNAGTPVEQMRISSAGNLLIGSPAATDESLVVAGDVKVDGGAGFGIQHFGGVSDVTKITGRDSTHSSSPNTMAFYAGSLVRMLINSDGTVEANYGLKSEGTGANSFRAGTSAGATSQGTLAVAIGYQSGFSGQLSQSVAIGRQAGETTQGTNAVSVGTYAGQVTQNSNGIAIGNTAGNDTQGTNAVAIGTQAGETSQGANAIAIGNKAGQTNQAAGSLVINASGSLKTATSAGDVKIESSTAWLRAFGANWSVGGSFTATGDVTANSDSRLKENVEPIENALDKVDAINGVTFSLIAGDDSRRVGVIAQDVQAVLPEAVHEDEDGILSVAYGNMVGLLVEAVKELRAEVAELKGEK